MGMNATNPCPKCGSCYSDYIGMSLHACRHCDNRFNTVTQKWAFETRQTGLGEYVRDLSESGLTAKLPKEVQQYEFMIKGLREHLAEATDAIHKTILMMNPVTAYHRHGAGVPDSKMDRMCNWQIDLEKILRKLEEEEY